MAVTDDGLVAESLRARLQSMHPDFQVHVLECDTQGVRIQLHLKRAKGMSPRRVFVFWLRLSNRYHIW